jgi:hypothetical protein
MLFTVSVVSEVQAQSPAVAKLKSEDRVEAAAVYTTERCFSYSFISIPCTAITMHIK